MVDNFDLRIKPLPVWKQKKKLSKYGDYDLDGSLNYKDCNPYDPSKDGVFGRLVGVLTKDKYGQSAEDYHNEREQKAIVKRVIEKQKPIEAEKKGIERAKRYAEIKEKALKFANLGSRKKYTYDKETGKTYVTQTKGIAERLTKVMERPQTATGFKSTKGKYGNVRYSYGGISFKSAKRRLYGQTTGKVGRPKGTLSYRHIDPRTGKPMPATEWYRLQRALKRQAKAIAETRDIRETQGLAKQGIPPQQARMIVDTRQLRRAIQPQQVQQVQPQQYQVNPQQAYIQSEMARIQQMEPWARQNAVNMLRRRVQVDQRVQNEGVNRVVVPETPQRQEVSLMTGRPFIKQAIVNRERWTR